MSWVRTPLGSVALRLVHNFKEKEQRLVSSKSGLCVRVRRHVYPRTDVSVSWHYENPTKCVGVVQSKPHHHLIENYLILIMI